MRNFSNVVPAKKEQQLSWAMKAVDAIIMSGQNCYNEKDIENINYARGMVPESDFDYVTKLYVNPNTPDRVLPGRIRQVNTIAHLLNKAIGKYCSEELDYNVSVINKEGNEQKIEEISKIAAEKLARFTRQKSGINETLGAPIDVLDVIQPEDIEKIKAMDYSKYQTEAEINLSKALHWILTDTMKGMQYKLTNQLLWNYFVTGKMACDVYKGLEDPELDVIPTQNLIYDLDSTSPFIHKGRYAGYYYSATPQEIIDKCPNLSEEDVDYLNGLMENFGNIGAAAMAKTWTDGCNWYIEQNTLYIDCYKIYFKAIKWVKCKITPNKLDEDNPHVHFVGDDDKRNPNDKYEMRCTNTLWECTRIAGQIYYQCREMPNQIVSEDTPSERELPIKGIVDGLHPCIVDLLKPLESMKINAFYSIDRLVGQAKGKILIVDEATEDNPLDNHYNMMAYGVYRVNSAKEGDMQLNGGQIIQPKEIDMGLSQAVSDLMRFIQFLDTSMLLVTGLNEGYMGIVNSNTGLGTQQNAIQQAQMSLYPYISTWYNVIQSSLQEICNLFPVCWKGSDKIKYYVGERGQNFFNLSKDTDWYLNRYGLVVQNKLKQQAQKQNVIQTAQMLLPTTNDPNFALALLKMVNSQSVAEAEEILQNGVTAINKLKAETEKNNLEQARMQQQANAERLQVESELEMKRINMPLEVERLKGQNEMALLEQKLRHSEDSQDVKFKQDVKKSIVDAELEKSTMQ